MANSKISALTNYTTPDGVNDVIPIVDNTNSQTKKITRNNYLGITGNPVGHTDTQTLSNKTLGNTNTISLKGTLFTLQDDSDTSKQARFVMSGITTATTRSYTLPNATGTLVDLASSQTLTNKTLTAPVITGGSIDNTSITVDTINGHTSANTITLAGNTFVSSGLAFTANTVSSLNTINAQSSSHLALSAGTSKLVKSTVLRQDDTTNTYQAGNSVVLTGWGVVVPGAAAFLSETVTFGVTFTQRPIVNIVFGGDNTAGTLTYGSGTPARKAAVAMASTITTTNFLARLDTKDAGNWTAGDSVFYQWTAIGEI